MYFSFFLHNFKSSMRSGDKRLTKVFQKILVYVNSLLYVYMILQIIYIVKISDFVRTLFLWTDSLYILGRV